MSNFNLKLKKTKNLLIGCFQLFKTSEKAKTNKNFAQYCILTQFFQSSDFLRILVIFEEKPVAAVLGSNCCSFIAIFAALSSATQKCERAFKHKKLFGKTK